MRVGAFFDLDGTLLSVNSGALWVRRERRLGRLGLLRYLEAVAYLIAYRLNTIDMELAMRRALGTVKGEAEETVRGWTRDWYHAEVVPHAAPGGLSVIEQHRAAGHVLVLLTMTSPYEAELAAAHFGLDAWLSTIYEVRAGVLTGEAVAPLCYGRGKVERAERFAAEHGVDLARSYFYSDSASDLPMLGRVGHPHAVNPDARLRWHARRRGWPVLDWRGA
ncbi:MAG: HAD family hydrolase [Proteobacteria bacterium]|nr:HAD family hydrolase [Pseudomonadota bacterium]